MDRSEIPPLCGPTPSQEREEEKASARFGRDDCWLLAAVCRRAPVGCFVVVHRSR